MVNFNPILARKFTSCLKKRTKNECYIVPNMKAIMLPVLAWLSPVTGWQSRACLQKVYLWNNPREQKQQTADSETEEGKIIFERCTVKLLPLWMTGTWSCCDLLTYWMSLRTVCLRNIGRHVYPLALMPHRSSHLRVSLSPFQTPYMCTMRVSTGISWIRILQSWDAGGVHIAEFATAAVIRIKDGLGEPEVGNKRWPTDFLFNTVN